MRRFHRIRPAWLIASVAGSLLVACAEEDAGPQFASDPRPTRAPTVAVAPQATPALLPTAAPMATPASFTDLLAVRGAVSRVFLAREEVVWTISSIGEADLVFEAPEGFSIQAIDPSPSAQEVAILLEPRPNDRGNAEVVVVKSSGDVLNRVSDLGRSEAAPVPAVAATSHTIDWSPQGDRVLVTAPSGEIVDIVIDQRAASTVLQVNEKPGTIVDPRWSPTGETIAFISASDDGRSRSLWTLDTKSGRVAPVITPAETRLVVDYAWMPDGVSLLFTEGGAPGGAATGIDLWRVDASGENRQLVVSAGTVAPVARIANVTPSRDGRSVAYSVLVPGTAGPLVDSVWVRELASGVGFRVPLPSVAAVEDIWWTNQGLILSIIAFGTTDDRQLTQALLQLKTDGSIAALWAAPEAPATPGSETVMATPTVR